MNFTKTAIITAALALSAAPAYAQAPEGTPDQTSNPGTTFQQENQPDGTPTQTDNPGTTYQQGAPYSGESNPGTTQERPTRSQARALGREHCQEFKTNFKQNRSAFGKCVAAVAKALRSERRSARAVCDASNLTRRRLDGQKRSDFKACVRAVANARKDAARSDS